MSRDRGDCEHGHASQVMVFAEKIAGEHSVSAKSAALVFQDHGTIEPPTVIGKFNTSALGSMAMAMLLKTAEHEPDGCPDCDAMGAAAALALEVFHQERRRLLAALSAGRKH